MLPILPLLLSATLSTDGNHATLLDIRTDNGAQVSALKQAPGVTWWVELGNNLLLVGPGGITPSLPEDARILGALDGVTDDQLVLRATGCAAQEDAPGKLLALGPRWQLRRLMPNERLPSTANAEESWRRVWHNEVVAHRYALDAPVAAAADPLIQPMVDHIDTVRWFADLSQLATWDRSSYGTTGISAARDWIADQFTALGLAATKPDFVMPGTSGSITRQNIIGTWTGTTLPDEWVVIGAHYDSRNANLHTVTSTPGAEDNASGCAGVIEMARALIPFQPQRSILFMCYAGEEQGLYGSTRHVQALQASHDIDKITAVVVMDMIGYSADNQLDAQYEAYDTWLTYMNRFAAAAATYVPNLNVVISTNPFGSDHMPYLDAGKQTVLGIEYDNEVYPYYHKSTDTPDHIGPNAQAMGGAILKTNVAVLAELVGASDRIFAHDFEAGVAQ
jgi:hypothetical protein